MKPMDDQDKQRYRKIAEVRRSATIFGNQAEQAFAERDDRAAAEGVGAMFNREHPAA